MTSVLHYKVQELAPGLNKMLRMHYLDRGRIRDRWTTELLDQRNGGPIRLKRCSVLIRRYYARNPLDLDNLYAASKIPLDALMRAGIIHDDSLEVVMDLTVHQFKVDHVKDERTEIDILELEPSPA